MDVETATVLRRLAASTSIERSRKLGDIPQLFDLTGARRVALVRPSGMGDVLMVTPLARHLARLGVSVEILTLRRYRCLWDGNPYATASRVSADDFAFDASRWDAYADLSACGELECYPAHQAAAFGAICGVALDDVSLDYFVTEAEREWAAEELTTRFARDAEAQTNPERVDKVVGYVWEAVAANRSWTEAANERAVDALLEAGFTVAIFGGRECGAAERSGLIDFTGQTSIREAAALIAECAAVVAPDTGLMHLAQAVGTPVVGYFGAFPASERATAPLVLVNDPSRCQHAPCRQHCCAFLDDLGNKPCLQVRPDIVVGRVASMIRGDRTIRTDKTYAVR